MERAAYDAYAAGRKFTLRGMIMDSSYKELCCTVGLLIACHYYSVGRILSDFPLRPAERIRTGHS